MTKNKLTSIAAEPGTQEIVITRDFDAPRELLFKALTDPIHIPHWWGPRGLTTVVDKMEVRPGGMWRFVQHDADGKEFAFHGVYHEVTAPERIIDTFEFEGLPEKGHVILETVRLEVLPGDRTKLTTQSIFQSVSDRDGMLQSGIKVGVKVGADEEYNRLDELLARELAK